MVGVPLLTFDDFRLLREKIKQGHGRRVLRALATVIPSDRVRMAWRHVEAPRIQWGSLEPVRRRWNLLATGDPGLTVYQYLADSAFRDRSDLVALSVGCGTGAHELRLLGTGRFARIDAFDISPERIAEATLEARKAGFGDRAHFFEADARTADFGSERYDTVLAFNALHHVSGLEVVIPRLVRSLKPSGTFVVWDYVGPPRFQWNKTQLGEVDKLLHEMPERLRRRWRSGSVKRREFRRGSLGMKLLDPSEAVESHMILETLARTSIRQIESRPLGGAILQPLLADIAHNFADVDNDLEAATWLDRLFDVEDELMASGRIQSDFVFACYRL